MMVSSPISVSFRCLFILHLLSKFENSVKIWIFTTMNCSIKGCANKINAKSLCSKHYMRMRTHGSPYACKYSERGSGYVNKRGYREFIINGRRIYEHRLIMERHLGRLL